MTTFKEFEHAGWQSVADGYHDYFGSLTQQTITALCSAIEPLSGTKVLDVATGPGYVARELHLRGALVAGIDFSSVMIDRARNLFQDIEFKIDDAENLSFPDGTFDAVAMNFGILHFDEPEKAIAEAYRVLRPNGRFAFSVWDLAEHSLGFKVVLDAVAAKGDPAVQLPPGPPFFRFSNDDESRRVMNDAGFSQVRTERVPMTWVLGTSLDVFNAFYLGTPRTGGLLRAQTSDALDAVKEELSRSTRRFSVGDHLEIPMVSLVVYGQKADL
ncbi:MAG: methyltransferase domain-containing protein [Cyanobacteria bacterium]|nr:methyltransferase domain-containing protein [Cyanobacteriota bacterium]